MNFQKLLIAISAIVLIAAFALISGCSNDESPVQSLAESQVDNLNPNQMENGGEVEPPVLASYPNYSFALSVPWLCQMPPKNPNHTDAQAWARSNNCGQAVAVMLGGYFNNGSVATWVIDAENRYLGYPLPYGSGMGSSTLRSLLWNFHRVHSAEYHGNHADDVIHEVVINRRPTIVCVTIKNGILVPRGTSGSRTHWALAVGWDSRVILHDPGTRYGRYKAYSVSAFEASWADNKCYIPTWK